MYLRMVIRLTLFLCIGILAVGLVFSCKDNSVPSKAGGMDTFPTDTFPAYDRNALYVQVGMTGDGSSANPLGSIQTAVDSAAHDQKISRILISYGEYVEQVVIHTPIILSGGCDPGNAWSIQSDSVSTVRCSVAPPTTYPLAVWNVKGTVQLSHLSLRGAEATDSGGNSIAVYFYAVDTVILRKCGVMAGAAMCGKTGMTGMAGRNGDKGYYSSPGLLPVKGGKGGHYGLIGQFVATVGEQGYCADGTQTGGLAATLSNWKSGDGQSGENGQDGVAGRYGLIARTGGDQLQFFARDGDSGTTGGFGCGGGGGCGSNGRMDRDGPIPGCDGGGGGAGAAPGSGGSGGGAGGSSVGIFCAHSTLILDSTSIWSGAAGDGGSGGAGGKGGTGGKEEIAPCVAGMTGSNGGAGGNGGNGGNGGGGAGGWSIGILLYKSQKITSDNYSAVIRGRAGLGGSQGQGDLAGANGTSVQFLEY